MIEAIIFDCFGVIITDALETLIQKLRETQPERIQEVRDIVAAGNRGLLVRDVYQTELATIFGLTLEEYRKYLAQGEVKDQRILDYAKELRQVYKTALLSNVSPGGITRRFRSGELEASFDAIITSGETGFIKPEPQAYALAADRLGVRLEACAFIDDREDYCIGAQSTGMHAIQYVDFMQMKKELSALLERE
jgi:HAD superfamily hydrolase (TIGR01509 family)